MLQSLPSDFWKCYLCFCFCLFLTPDSPSDLHQLFFFWLKRKYCPDSTYTNRSKNTHEFGAAGVFCKESKNTSPFYLFLYRERTFVPSPSFLYLYSSYTTDLSAYATTETLAFFSKYPSAGPWTVFLMLQFLTSATRGSQSTVLMQLWEKPRPAPLSAHFSGRFIHVYSLTNYNKGKVTLLG